MARTPRDVAISALDTAVSALKAYTETCPHPERLVGLYPALVELRARFEQATAAGADHAVPTHLTSEDRALIRWCVLTISKGFTGGHEAQRAACKLLGKLAPDDSTLVTNLIRETVTIRLGLSTVCAVVDDDDPTLVHVWVRAREGPQDLKHSGYAKWDAGELHSPDLQLSLDPGVNADAWDRLSAELRKAEGKSR